MMYHDSPPPEWYEPPDEEPEEDVVQDDDITTPDYHHFYQYNKEVVYTPNEDWRTPVQNHMQRQQFWPNVWFINDHGNVTLENVWEDA